MNAGVLESLAPEMELIEKRISKYCQIRSGYLGEFAHLNLDYLDRYLRPACVLLAVTEQTANRSKVVALAAIIQLIYLAAKIHHAVPEDFVLEQNPSSDYRDGTQLPVLVGDYLYGRFFTSLCEAEALDLLRPLAELICVINEGAILRFEAEQAGDQSQQTMLKIIEQETAVLFSGACRLSSSLAQASLAEQTILADFGLNLGMAYGIMRELGNQQLAKEYAELALTALDQLSNTAVQPKLQQLVTTIISPKTAASRSLVG